MHQDGIEFAGDLLDVGFAIAEGMAEVFGKLVDRGGFAKVNRLDGATGSEDVGGIAGIAPLFTSFGFRVERLVQHQFHQGGIGGNLGLHSLQGNGLGFAAEFGTATVQFGFQFGGLSL